MRLLFVCGFNAALCACSGAPYDGIRAHLAGVGFDAKYFMYKWTECAESVYTRLHGVLSGSKFDALVAYSLGATLVARYLTVHADAAAAYRRVVLCMPLLVPNATLALLARAPLSPLVPLPLAPHGTLCRLQQVVHVYRHWLDNTEKVDAVALLERPNVHVLYALCETRTPIPWRVLSRAANLHVVHGGHAAHASPASQFFAALDAALGMTWKQKKNGCRVKKWHQSRWT
jgi:hypothetical protein